MKRLLTINSFIGSEVVDYCIEPVPIGKYQVDDTHFVPTSEAVKSITGSGSSDLISQFNYDYGDGKDTGFKVPVDRTHRLDPLVDTSVALRENSKLALEKAQKKARAKDLEDRLNNFNSSLQKGSSAQSAT